MPLTLPNRFRPGVPRVALTATVIPVDGISMVLFAS